MSYFLVLLRVAAAEWGMFNPGAYFGARNIPLNDQSFLNAGFMWGTIFNLRHDIIDEI